MVYHAKFITFLLFTFLKNTWDQNHQPIRRCNRGLIRDLSPAHKKVDHHFKNSNIKFTYLNKSKPTDLWPIGVLICWFIFTRSANSKDSHKLRVIHKYLVKNCPNLSSWSSAMTFDDVGITRESPHLIGCSFTTKYYEESVLVTMLNSTKWFKKMNSKLTQLIHFRAKNYSGMF